MKDKFLALKLLQQKMYDSSLAYPIISEKTGYSKRQLIRLSESLYSSANMETLCRHANAGKEPVNKALHDEIQFLIDLKKPYPSITISQFRDIFFEDILNNPAMSNIIHQYHLKPLRQNVFGAFMIFNYEVFQQPYTALFHHQHFLGKQQLANFQIYCLLSSELHQHSVGSDPIPILLILLDLLLRHHWK